MTGWSTLMPVSTSSEKRRDAVASGRESYEFSAHDVFIFGIKGKKRLFKHVNVATITCYFMKFILAVSSEISLDEIKLDFDHIYSICPLLFEMVWFSSILNRNVLTGYIKI